MTLESLALRLQPLAIRTGAGPLRPLWALGHAAVIRAVARRLTSGMGGARVYLKGGFGFGRPVYGLSDVDMMIVTPDADHASAVVGERWRALKERFPTLVELFNDGEIWVYRAGDAAALRDDSYLTYGLVGGAVSAGHDRAAFLGRSAPHDPMGLLDHPGLYGPQRDWRALGSRRRPPPPAASRGPSERAIHAWLELRFIWGYAFRTCADPGRASAAHMCLKLVSDPARVWLWLVHGEQLFDRTEVLERVLQLLPSEEPALTWALEFRRRLRVRPDPPLAEALPFLARMSARIGASLSRLVEEAGSGYTRVRLRWEGGWPRLPLLDWRALAIPGRLDDEFIVWPGDPGDPDRVAAAAAASDGAAFVALRADGLLVVPTTEIWHRGRLRGVECEVTDPVSFALVAGEERAAFPDLPGWSAQDVARRAVAEHRGWLAGGPAVEGNELPYWAASGRSPALAELHGLFGAARAALFAAGLQQDEPSLALTPAAVASQLAESRPEAWTVVAAAYGEMLQATAWGTRPSAATAARLREVVCGLEPYRTVGA